VISERVSGLRILVADDHAATADILARLLSRFGHRVEQASCVEEARERAADLRPDLLISDLALPDGDGIELRQSLTQLESMRSILLSGSGRLDDLDAARAAGYDCCLQKPVDVDVLQKTIERLFGAQGQDARG